MQKAPHDSHAPDATERFPLLTEHGENHMNGEINLKQEKLWEEYLETKQQAQALETEVSKSKSRRRALLHILSDLTAQNRKLNDQRKAMIHILADYEQDRRRLEKQTERVDNSRRALIHILQDAYQSNVRLENSRKAMIHIMSDLRETTEAVQKREQELREKQEQLVQAAKLATLGELTTGIAHELNNPLNNIGLFIGNAIDLIEFGRHAGHAGHAENAGREGERERILNELNRAMQQVWKATEIISHLRTFGRAAPVSYQSVEIQQVISRAISLVQEQLRLRQIEVELHLPEEEVIINGNPIQLEQVFLNLLTNARDALVDQVDKRIIISCVKQEHWVEIRVLDTGTGIPAAIEKRIFDPFFTTKEVGAGTGLGLSITYSIIQEHKGSIQVEQHAGPGALILIQLPRAHEFERQDSEDEHG